MKAGDGGKLGRVMLHHSSARVGTGVGQTGTGQATASDGKYQIRDELYWVESD